MKSKFTARWIPTLLLISLACWIFSPLVAVAQESKPAVQFAIIAPENNSTVKPGEILSVVVTANLQDIKNITISCDDRNLVQLDKPPFVASLDTSLLATGAHIFKASASLKDDRKFDAQPVKISVLPRGKVASRPGNTIVLKEGTPLLLLTTKKLVSGKEQEGATVNYTVARDVLSPNKKVLVELGAPAYGKITKSRKRGMLGKNGKLEFTVESVEAVDGTTIPIRGSEQVSGRNNSGVVAASVLLFTVLAVFVNGRDIEIPEGTEVAAYVDRDALIDASFAKLTEETPRGVKEETVAVQLPGGSRVRKGEPLQVTVSPQPAEKAFRLRVVIAGAEKLNRDKNFSPFDISTKDLPTGRNTLQVEVTFRSGLVVRQSADFEVY
jgi:hypothetical protein